MYYSHPPGEPDQPDRPGSQEGLREDLLDRLGNDIVREAEELLGNAEGEAKRK
jgi:hypothetical protein